MVERERKRVLVLVQRVTSPARQAPAGLLVGVGFGLWLVLLVGVAQNRPLVLPVTVLGLILLQGIAGVVVWWREQEAECEAAESQLLLEHAVADVHAEDEREFVVFD